MSGIEDAPAVKTDEVRGYLDDPSRRYAAGLKKLKTAADVRAFLATWPFLAADAIKQAEGFTDEDVTAMQRCRHLRNPKKLEAAITKYGLVLIPARLLTLTEFALQFKAPEGAVYLRLWETGEHDRLMKVRPS